MEVKLNLLYNVVGSKKLRKRVGRGIASGVGKTCGRGMKGQKSRSGVSIKTEGGQMPIIKRLPKRGFNSFCPISYNIVNIFDITNLVKAKVIDAKTKITKDLLFSLGYIKSKKNPLKLLGSRGMSDLDYKFKLEFDVDACSDSVRSLVESVGGKINIKKS